MSKLNKQFLRVRGSIRNTQQKFLIKKIPTNILSGKIQNFIFNIAKKIKIFNFNNEKYGIIADVITAFIAMTISTIMRMGCGIFEYSLISLLLNGLVYSLVTGSIFIKTGIVTRDRENFSALTIKKIFTGVAIVNAIAYPLVMLADRQNCLSSSIVFIDFFVFIVLLLVPYVLSKQYPISKASDVLIGKPKHVSDVISKNSFGTSEFNPMGFILTEETDYIRDYPIPLLGWLSDIPAILRSLEAKEAIPKRFIIIDPIASDKIKMLKEYTMRNKIVLLQIFGSEFES